MPELRQLPIEEASKYWYQLSTYEPATYQAWFEECKSNRSFHEGEQFTEDEKTIMTERGQYMITMNKIRKAIKGITGLVTAGIPKYKLVATNKDNDNKAAIGNKILDWIWNKSGGLALYKNIVKSALIDNIAYFHVKTTANNLVQFEKLSFDDVLVDPSSKSPTFDDAEMIVIRRYVPVSYAEAVFNLHGNLELII